MALALAAVPPRRNNFRTATPSSRPSRTGREQGDRPRQRARSVVNQHPDRSTGEGALHYGGAGARYQLVWPSFSARAQGPISIAIAATLRSPLPPRSLAGGAEHCWPAGPMSTSARPRRDGATSSAAQRRDLAMVRMLLARRADPNRPDRFAGMSALDYAGRIPGGAVLNLLEAKVRRPSPPPDLPAKRIRPDPGPDPRPGAARPGGRNAKSPPCAGPAAAS